MSDIPFFGLTVNPFAGCYGCELSEMGTCYALTRAVMLAHNPNKTISNRYKPLVERVNGQWRWTGKHFFDLSILERAVRRKKSSRLFVGSMGDVRMLHAGEWVKLCLTMARAPRHDFVLMTKTPIWLHHFAGALIFEAEAKLHKDELRAFIRSHKLIIGTSVTSEETSGRLADLVGCWPGRKFISCEPLLGPVQFDRRLLRQVEYVIIGCESGPGARPTRLEWVRALLKQCTKAGIPVMVKQLRGYPCELTQYPPVERPYRTGSFDGVNHVDANHAALWHPSIEGGGVLIHLPGIDSRVWDERPECLRLEDTQ